MADALFWDIVGLLDWSKWRKDQWAVLEPAIARLSELPIREILLFEEFLRWRLYTLDTREHARYSGSGEECDSYTGPDVPFSTDGFLDRRAMAVAKGQAEYEAVLTDPTRMPKEGFEVFVSLARQAYERKTGDIYEHRSGISRNAGSNPAGWLDE